MAESAKPVDLQDPIIEADDVGEGQETGAYL
jgi:hypothetical protein